MPNVDIYQGQVGLQDFVWNSSSHECWCRVSPWMDALHIIITLYSFFFLFHNIFISPSSAARKTPTVHISAAQQSSALLYTRNVQCDKNFTRRKGFTQTEFHAMNLPMRTCFTTLKITFLQNCENIFKKKRRLCKLSRLRGLESTQRKKNQCPNTIARPHGPRHVEM